MSVLALTIAAVGAGGFGAGVFLGAIVLRPRVGPWYGPAKFNSMPTAHATQRVSLAREMVTDMSTSQAVSPVTPALSGTVVYVMTEHGLTPVRVAFPQHAVIELPPALDVQEGRS